MARVLFMSLFLIIAITAAYAVFLSNKPPIIMMPVKGAQEVVMIKNHLVLQGKAIHIRA